MDRKRREAEWAEAGNRCRLNAETLWMARELGLNPRTLIKNVPSKSQPWKAPVADQAHATIAERTYRRDDRASQLPKASRRPGDRRGFSGDRV